MKEAFEEALASVYTGETKLAESVRYALLSGGKRIRPLLVLQVAEALGKRDVMASAVAIECFHTASLIADDLPCMDDDKERRGKKSVHVVFGEAPALLASYALIAKAFEKIEENGRQLGLLQETMICLEQASRSAGAAVLGQYYDLFGTDSVEKMHYLKTGTLFEGAFVLGWVFGGGALDRLEHVRELAAHVGCAFQRQDDLEDGEGDGQTRGQLIHHVDAAHQLLNDLSLQALIPLLEKTFLKSHPLTLLRERDFV